jgi:hypothetical protein
MKHRWYAPKGLNSRLCRTCGASDWIAGAESDCLVARHPDREIDALYRARRKAARSSSESGLKGIRGWDDLERVERQLREIDPDGDWRYEGDRWDGRGYRVDRPTPAA